MNLISRFLSASARRGRLRTRELCASKPRSASADVPAPRSVVLVDDESPVREATRAMLDDLGYAVTEAGSAPDVPHLAKPFRQSELVEGLANG